MHVVLTSYASPWFFGPYGQQLRMLGEILMKKGVDISYLLLGSELPKRIHTYAEVRGEDKDTNNVAIDESIWSKVNFLGGVKHHEDVIFSNNLNDIFMTFSVDAFIICMDLNKIAIDQEFVVKSIVWFPNHFCPLDKYNKQTLSHFSHIASLSPTNKEIILSALPEKKVEFIPHIIDFKYELKGKDVIRAKYEISSDKFVVLINAGNYDFQNRKSLDTSIFAFEKFAEKHDNVLLFIHTYSVNTLKKNPHLKVDGVLRLVDLLEYTSIPKEKFVIHEKIVPYNEVLELFEMADVLLHGSKSEGFGVPILEAQLIGTPVVTTKFGAMEDYTLNGISVPYVQKCFDNLGSGVWVTPSVDGTADAVEIIYNKELEDKKDLAIDYITTEMSGDVVSEKFIEIFKEEFIVPEIKVIESNKVTIIDYDSKDNSFTIGKTTTENLTLDMLSNDWVVIKPINVSCNQPLIEDLIEKNREMNNDLMMLKTKYKKEIYPTTEALMSRDIRPYNIIYCVKSKYVKEVLGKVENEKLSAFVFAKNMSKFKTGISDNIICIEK